MHILEVQMDRVNLVLSVAVCSTPLSTLRFVLSGCSCRSRWQISPFLISGLEMQLQLLAEVGRRQKATI